MNTQTPYDLVNRYLQAVQQHLPAAAAGDVLAELGANLSAEIEDAAEERGRALEAAEIAAILRRHGHPLQVAGRYRPQRYLIGPQLLPIYGWVLKLALTLAWIVYVTVNAVALTVAGEGTRAALLTVVSHSPDVLMWTFGWVTLAFAALEWGAAIVKARLPVDRWDPMKLPRVRERARPRWSWRTGLELLPGACAVLYWLAAVPAHPWLMFGPGATVLDYSPQLIGVFWPILALALAAWALDWAGACYGPETWQRRVKGGAAKLVAIAIFAVLLSAGEIAVAAPPYQAVAHTVNTMARLGLRVALLVAALLLLADVARLAWRAAQKRAAAR